jgi:hypothetical protein
VHEEAEDVDEGEGGEEGEGAEEGEQQEEEEGYAEGEQTSRSYVVTGVIDEGEETPKVMRQYQRELEADERALEEDSSDDDCDDDDDESEDHVPLDWQNYDFSRCTVNTGENVPWEYTENEVCVGAMFPSNAHLKDAVKQWSTLNLHKEFRVLKSSPRVYDVCCIKDGCSFRVYAYMEKWNNYVQVKEVKGQTCTLDPIDAIHRNISADFVASHMYPHIVKTPEFAPKAIIGAIEEKFGYTIGYGKAYQAKTKVLEHRWGTYEASYHNLPNLLHTIV